MTCTSIVLYLVQRTRKCFTLHSVINSFMHTFTLIMISDYIVATSASRIKKFPKRLDLFRSLKNYFLTDMQVEKPQYGEWKKLVKLWHGYGLTHEKLLEEWFQLIVEIIRWKRIGLVHIRNFVTPRWIDYTFWLSFNHLVGQVSLFAM